MRGFSTIQSIIGRAAMLGESAVRDDARDELVRRAELLVAGELRLGHAPARLEDDEVGCDVGEVVRVEQAQEADLELAVFALGRGRLVVRPGVLPLGEAAARRRRSSRNAQKEAMTITTHHSPR